MKMSNDVTEAIRRAREQRLELIYKGFNLSEDDIQKGREENPFDIAAAEADMEKSDVMDALSYSGDIRVTKTGKEIKKQVDDVLLPELNANLAVKNNEATEKLKACGKAPTHDIDKWWTSGVKLDVGFKCYEWEETSFRENESNSVSGSLSAEDAVEKRNKSNFPTSADEAQSRREYNDIIRCICDIKVDIKACEILKGLKDEKVFELTPRQVICLRL